MGLCVAFNFVLCFIILLVAHLNYIYYAGTKAVACIVLATGNVRQLSSGASLDSVGIQSGAKEAGVFRYLPQLAIPLHRYDDQCVAQDSRQDD